MNKKLNQEIKSKVTDALSDYYINQGFKLKKSTKEFLKGDFSVFWGESSKGVDSVVFRPSITLENKEISNIQSVIFPESLKNNTIVRVLDLDFAEEFGVGDFESPFVDNHGLDGKSYYYRVAIDTNVEPIVSDHIRFMESIGLPFIEKLSSLEGIHEYINERVLKVDDALLKIDEKQKELKKGYGKREVLSGVVVSYLLKRGDTNLLLKRIKLLFEGNDYVLNDVRKIEEYFKSQSSPTSASL
ncbi:hypothetical protein BUL40_06205 [Croceivirga radicis]|uniref:Uncharacterized protein n=1 Tax=Croceivirga radicis TaxID=1929488 RepID=A0A1V6LTA8_9FLAO|nr:hypothetical protein [Croceivirga radicis]OQD43420.1 hypothetical protein BUL40_06205 [Croceivirga radicis]